MKNIISVAKERILKRTIKAKTKVEKTRAIIDVLHEMKLYDVPKETTLELASRFGVRIYHPHIRHALKIIKALDKKPETIEEVIEGAKKAELDLSERRLREIAQKGFGINKSHSKSRKTVSKRLNKKNPSRIVDSGLWDYLVERGKRIYTNVYSQVPPTWHEVYNAVEEDNYYRIATKLVKYVGKTGDPVAFLTTLKYYNLHEKLSMQDINALAREFKLNPKDPKIRREIENLVRNGQLSTEFVSYARREILQKVLLLMTHDLRDIYQSRENKLPKESWDDENLLSFIAYHLHRVMDADTPRKKCIAEHLLKIDGTDIITKRMYRIHKKFDLKNALENVESKLSMIRSGRVTTMENQETE